MYCFFEFLKPGRHNYCISHNDPEPSLLNSNQQDFYVHDVVANVRDEIIPSCKSPYPLIISFLILYFLADKLDFEGNLVPVYEEMTVQSTTVRQSTVMQPGDLGNLTSSIMGSVEKINDSAASAVSKSSNFQGSQLANKLIDVTKSSEFVGTGRNNIDDDHVTIIE